MILGSDEKRTKEMVEDMATKLMVQNDSCHRVTKDWHGLGLCKP